MADDTSPQPAPEPIPRIPRTPTAARRECHWCPEIEAMSCSVSRDERLSPIVNGYDLIVADRVVERLTRYGLTDLLPDMRRVALGDIDRCAQNVASGLRQPVASFHFVVTRNGGQLLAVFFFVALGLRTRSISMCLVVPRRGPHGGGGGGRPLDCDGPSFARHQADRPVRQRVRGIGRVVADLVACAALQLRLVESMAVLAAQRRPGVAHGTGFGLDWPSSDLVAIDGRVRPWIWQAVWTRFVSLDPTGRGVSQPPLDPGLSVMTYGRWLTPSSRQGWTAWPPGGAHAALNDLRRLGRRDLLSLWERAASNVEAIRELETRNSKLLGEVAALRRDLIANITASEAAACNRANDPELFLLDGGDELSTHGGLDEDRLHEFDAGAALFADWADFEATTPLGGLATDSDWSLPVLYVSPPRWPWHAHSSPSEIGWHTLQQLIFSQARMLSVIAGWYRGDAESHDV